MFVVLCHHASYVHQSPHSSPHSSFSPLAMNSCPFFMLMLLSFVIYVIYLPPITPLRIYLIVPLVMCRKICDGLCILRHVIRLPFLRPALEPRSVARCGQVSEDATRRAQSNRAKLVPLMRRHCRRKAEGARRQELFRHGSTRHSE